ncbi:unnamed protein product [Choristocarpus tenellus]
MERRGRDGVGLAGGGNPTVNPNQKSRQEETASGGDSGGEEHVSGRTPPVTASSSSSVFPTPSQASPSVAGTACSTRDKQEQDTPRGGGCEEVRHAVGRRLRHGAGQGGQVRRFRQKLGMNVRSSSRLKSRSRSIAPNSPRALPRALPSEGRAHSGRQEHEDLRVAGPVGGGTKPEVGMVGKEENRSLRSRKNSDQARQVVGEGQVCGREEGSSDSVLSQVNERASRLLRRKDLGGGGGGGGVKALKGLDARSTTSQVAAVKEAGAGGSAVVGAESDAVVGTVEGRGQRRTAPKGGGSVQPLGMHSPLQWGQRRTKRKRLHVELDARHGGDGKFNQCGEERSRILSGGALRVAETIASRVVGQKCRKHKEGDTAAGPAPRALARLASFLPGFD